MNSLLINGVYDLDTFEILVNQNVKEFSFDLRGRSPNLVTFNELKRIFSKLDDQKVFLTFENDKKETVLSSLNILGVTSDKASLIFRDTNSPAYYESLNFPFHWMFNPEGQWREILSLKNCKGVLLPVRLQNQYRVMPELWNLFEEKNLDVYLHAETFEQTAFMKLDNEIKLSLDLSQEVETSYRKIDHQKLKSLRFWRMRNETSARQ